VDNVHRLGRAEPINLEHLVATIKGIHEEFPMSHIRSVCIVDDAAGMRRLGQSLLSSANITVFTASDGYQALDVIREHQPDACIIDREMEGIDGLQLIQLLRHWSGWGDKPIAMLSSASSIFDKQAGLLAGANTYMTKPFTRESILSAMQELESFLE